MTTALAHPAAAELAAVPLFAGLTAVQCATLAHRMDVEPFRSGDVIVLEGMYGYAFYVLRSGEVEVRHDATVLRRLRRHDFFGELAILGDGHRQATVVATEPGVMWRMAGTTFRVLVAEHPEIACILAAAAP